MFKKYLKPAAVFLSELTPTRGAAVVDKNAHEFMHVDGKHFYCL